MTPQVHLEMRTQLYAIHSTVLVGISPSNIWLVSSTLGLPTLGASQDIQPYTFNHFPLHSTVEAPPEHRPYAIHSTVIVNISPCILHIGSPLPRSFTVVNSILLTTMGPPSVYFVPMV